MLLPLYLVIPSAMIVIVTVPIYVVMLVTQWKYREKPPFDSAFFKLSFHLGIFDMCHLFNGWVIGMLPYLGLHEFIVAHANVFAKQYNLVWWYTALGRKFGVVLLAVDRVATMWFNKKLNDKQIYVLLAFNWIFPLVLTAPQAFIDFSFRTFNYSNGVLVYWVNHHYELIHFRCCVFLCATASIVCGISYGLAFRRVYNRRKNSISSASRDRKDSKLAIVGFIQFFITFLCAIFCGVLVSMTEPEGLIVMIGVEQLLFDVYSCLNPYLILTCSNSMKTHFKAVLCRQAPQNIETTTNGGDTLMELIRTSSRRSLFTNDWKPSFLQNRPSFTEMRRTKVPERRASAREWKSLVLEHAEQQELKKVEHSRLMSVDVVVERHSRSPNSPRYIKY